MKEPEVQRPPSGRSEEYERFKALVKDVVSVPKAEIDKRQREYERERQKLKRKKAVK